MTTQLISIPKWMTLEEVESFIKDQGFVAGTKEDLEDYMLNAPEDLRNRYTMAIGTRDSRDFCPSYDQYFTPDGEFRWEPADQQYLQGTSFVVKKGV